MKRSILCLMLCLGVLLCSGLAAFAWEIDLAWDANTEPDLAGYNLYYTTTQGIYNYTEPPVEVYIASDVSGMVVVPNGTHCWTLTASDLAGNESGPSNEVCISLPQDDTTPPAAPVNLHILEIRP